MRHLVGLALALGVFTSAAQAAPLLVLEPGGRAVVRQDPELPALDFPRPAGVRPAPRAVVASRRTVRSELGRLVREGKIKARTRDRDVAILRDAERTASRLSGFRRTELRSVLATMGDIAALGRITPSRLPAMFLTIRRNREWWSTGPALSYGQRISFAGSPLIWQYYPGQGIQLQMLGNWGKVNGEWMAHDNATLRHHIKDLLPLASARAGGIAWEYFFYFDGGRPPWTSALSQGTAVQALARAAKRLHWPGLRTVAKRGLAVFHAREPVGVRLPARHGPRYLIYSFSTHQLVLNAFVQSLVGLYDYSNITKSKEGWGLFHAAEPQARADTPLYDTGAWSLYQMGGPESDLSYHVLLRDFLHNLCRRTHHAAYCTAEAHFTSYLHRAPKPRIITTQVRAGETYYVRFAVDKVSSVSLVVSRNGRVARSFAGTISRGRHYILWAVPRSGAGDYSVRLAATDLAGNSASTSGAITALGPHKRPSQ